MLAHVEAGRLPTTTGRRRTSRALTTKEPVPVVNGPGGVDLKLEAELAELPAEEALAGDAQPSALEHLVRRLESRLDLLTFFTANENEARA